ncbi:MAG TPA: O-antigen ligase family protein [Gemmatimonadaceae bacterium]|nr:O-antigen ligase family protein [Gemmatimonadaceae bacterium]
MTSIALCIFAFFLGVAGGRRSLVTGVGCVLAVGYPYGILRANILQPFSHFIFDSAVVGLYVSQLQRPLTLVQRRRIRELRSWFIALIGWPVLLTLLPVQDYLVQLAGLRGNVFLLGFVLLGALMTADELVELTTWLAVLNLAAFGFAVAEYFVGIEPFFPRSSVTEIMYASLDIYTSSGAQYRIPATFSSAHAYAGTMAMTSTVFFGALNAGGRLGRRSPLVLAALLASLVGIFMAGARSPVVVIGLVILYVILFGGLRISTAVLGLVLAGTVGFVVLRTERLQRFLSLNETDYVSTRVESSLNVTFLDLAEQYPMGNGIGGGGTSIPYFLADRVRDRVGMENEYARIMLEQGLPGLLMWVAFLLSMLLRSYPRRRDDTRLARRLIWVYCVISFATAFIGTGLLASIPGSALLLMFLGFISPGGERLGMAAGPVGAASAAPAPPALRRYAT